MGHLPFVTLYTITYNQSAILGQVLKHLYQQIYPSDSWQIVVLDDGSSDGTSGLLAEMALYSPVHLKVIAESHVADYMSAKRWNQCIAYGMSNTDIFIQIDDVLTRPDFIQQHVKWHIKDSAYLVTGAKFEGQEETWELSACRRASLARQDGQAAEISFYTAVWGASLSFSKNLMERVYKAPYECPFDERMIGWGYHEVEMALRMRNAGCRIVYDPSAGVYHRNHTSQGEQARGLKRAELINAGEHNNREYTLHKHKLNELERW